MTPSGLIDQPLADIFNHRNSIPAPIKKPIKRTTQSAQNPMDAHWAPVKANLSPMEVLARCAWIVIQHSTVEAILFYWGLMALMDYQTSWLASVVVALIGGIRIGFFVKKNY